MIPDPELVSGKVHKFCYDALFGEQTYMPEFRQVELGVGPESIIENDIWRTQNLIETRLTEIIRNAA